MCDFMIANNVDSSNINNISSAFHRRQTWQKRQHPRLTKYGFASFDVSIEGPKKDKLCALCGNSLDNEVKTPKHGGNNVENGVDSRCPSCDQFEPISDASKIGSSHRKSTRASMAREEEIFDDVHRAHTALGTISMFCRVCKSSYCRDCVVEVHPCRGCWKQGVGQRMLQEAEQFWKEIGQRTDALRREYRKELVAIKKETVLELEQYKQQLEEQDVLLEEKDKEIERLKQQVEEREKKLKVYESMFRTQAELLEEEKDGSELLDSIRKRVHSNPWVVSHANQNNIESSSSASSSTSYFKPQEPKHNRVLRRKDMQKTRTMSAAEKEEEEELKKEKDLFSKLHYSSIRKSGSEEDCEESEENVPKSSLHPQFVNSPNVRHVWALLDDADL